MIWALGYDGTRSEAWTALESSFLSGSGNGAPPTVPAQGCSQAGAPPGWLLLLALLGRRRAGPYPGVHARKSSWFRRSTALGGGGRFSSANSRWGALALWSWRR